MILVINGNRYWIDDEENPTCFILLDSVKQVKH